MVSPSVEQSQDIEPANDDADAQGSNSGSHPSESQRRWLERGLEQPGGKLPLFDDMGQKFSERTVRSCIDHGWAEPWFSNALKPDWLVCELTDAGREAIST